MTGGLVQHDNLPIVSQGMLWPIGSVVRSSVATYYDQNMKVTEAPNNAQRVTHRIKRYENVLLQNRSITTSPWTAGGAPSAVQDQTGLDGAASKAWTLTDASNTQFGRYEQTVTIPNDATTHSAVFYVGKTVGAQTTFPGLVMTMAGGTSVLSGFVIDTTNGLLVARDTNAGDVQATIESYDDNYWKIVNTAVNNASGNTTLTYSVFPAIANAFDGSATVSAQGSCVYDFGGVFLNQKTAVPDHVLIETGATPKKQWQMFGNHLLDNRDLSTGNWLLDNTPTAAQNQTGVDGLPNKAWTITDNDAALFESYYQSIPIADDSSTHSVVFFIKKTTSAATHPGLGVLLANGAPQVQGFYTLNTDTGVATISQFNLGSHQATVTEEGDFWRVEIQITNNSLGNTEIRFYVYGAVNTDGAGTWDATVTGSCVYDYGHVFLYSHAAPDVLIESDSEVRYFNDIEIDGNLIEEQRTNLLLRSEEFDNAAYTKDGVTVSANATVSPDGATTADKIVENGAASVHRLFQSIGSLTSGTFYSAPIFAKAGERFKVRFTFGGAAFGADYGADYDLLTGQIIQEVLTPTRADIEAVGDGWYRLEITKDATVSSSGVLIAQLLDNAGNTSYTGDSSSGAHVFGGQLETGAFPTSYIKTVASQVTRLADVATAAIGEELDPLSDWSVVINFSFSAEDAARSILDYQGATSADRLAIFLNSSEKLGLELYKSSVLQAALTDGSAQAVGSGVKLAIRMSQDNIGLSVNGGAVLSDVTANLPPLTGRDLGFAQLGLKALNGTIKSIDEYSRALTDAELVEKSTL